MNPKEYQEAAAVTEAPITEKITQRLASYPRLQHSIMGIVTEAGELQDAFKKYAYYGKELDTTNVIEELGDVLWYVALACNDLNIPMEDVMQINIDKLAARYPEKFTEHKAINRDLEVENKIMEEAIGYKEEI